MKKILLLIPKQAATNLKTDPNKLLAELHTAATAKALDATFESALYEDLIHVIMPHKTAIIDTVSGKDIASFDVVYQRHWGNNSGEALSCALYLKSRKVPYLDRETGECTSGSKLSQSWMLHEAGLPYPETVFAGSGVQPAHIRQVLESTGFGWPLIMKDPTASRGSHNFMIKDWDQLEQKLAQEPGAYLLQRYIDNHSDYRVLVCGDVVRLVMHRKGVEGSHLNNTSQGGQATLVDVNQLPPRLIEDSVRAAAVFKRDVAGVDVVIENGTNRHYFFETNRSPQIESGQCVAEKSAELAAYLYQVSLKNDVDPN